MNSKTIIAFMFALLVVPIFTLFPKTTHAHEVYVLTKGEIQNAVSIASPNPLHAISENPHLFTMWALAIALLILLTFFLSFYKKIQRPLSPYLIAIKKYAPLIERITIGASLIASAYFQALFGPELPFSLILPGGEVILIVILYTIGILVMFGWLTRFVGVILGLIYLFSLMKIGVYLVSYFNYFGTALLLIIAGGTLYSVDNYFKKQKTETESAPVMSTDQELIRELPNEKIKEDRAFFVLRVFYGTALVFAAIYAKLYHSNLALDTIADYHLTNYFPFEPLFLVMGAFFVECVIGTFIIIGFQIRLATIVFTIFLTSSIIFFGESVWPHIILFGLNVAIFVHGYDKYTLMEAFTKEELEPLF